METNSLAEVIQRSKSERARTMTLDERLTAGATSFAQQLLLVREMGDSLRSHLF